MASSHKDFEIAVIGGGIAGLTLAIALHRRGVPVKVYEQAPKFGEIGAGVSFTWNALQSMKICDPAIYDAFEKVVNKNAWDSKSKVWFDYLDGTASVEGQHQKPEFTINSRIGQNGVHRAHYLDELVKLFPSSLAVFGKRFRTAEEGSNGRMIIHFEDGTTAEADAIVGCDGIKSKVRATIVGDDSPAKYPVYTHKYAYRAMIPVEEAVKVLGEENGKNACMHMGPGAHVLTFLVNKGKFVNIVAFKTNSEDWPDYNRLTRPSRREDALNDFSAFGPSIRKLLELAKADLDCWAIFDLHDHPVPSMNKGRILITGDAAHATSPHMGSGAGMAIEDSATLAEMLSSSCIKTSQDLEAVFNVFNKCRKERGQWLVNSSRRIGDLYEWRAEGVEKNFEGIEQEINQRNDVISNVNVREMCDNAIRILEKELQVKS